MFFKKIISKVMITFNRFSRFKRHLWALFKYASLKKLFNIALVEIEYKLKRIKVMSMPYYYLIDPSNICNLRCPLCPTTFDALQIPKQLMNFEKYQQLIKEISKYAVKISLYNWGEPFLNKHIINMIELAHKNRIATVVSTNINVLPVGGADALVKSGLDDLIVCIDGLTQETYEQYRRNGVLKNAISNLKEIVDAKKRLNSKTPIIEFQYLVFKHNEHEVPNVEKFAYSLGVDKVRLCSPFIDINSKEVRPAENLLYVRPEYIDSIKSENKAVNKQQAKNIGCFWPWRAMVINSNGQVDPCCSHSGGTEFGNAFETPIDELWNNNAFQYSRSIISNKKYIDKKVKIVCENCPGNF